MDCETSYLSRLERGELLTKDELEGLVERVSSILDAEPSLILTDCPIVVVPYLRGNFSALTKYLAVGGSPPETKYLFFGNYGSTGSQGLQTLSYILALKDLYPHRIILLRHKLEGTDARIYGLYDHIKKAYNSKPLYNAILTLFSYLPVAAVISHKIYCGGLAPNLHTLEAISNVDRRHREVYTYNDLEELLTSVASDKSDDWYMGNVRTSEYGKNIINKFCEHNGLDLMIRCGYEQSNVSEKLTTLQLGTIMKIRMNEKNVIETQVIEVFDINVV